MNLDSKIYVAGHRGLVGSALVRALRKARYNNLVLATHKELDLTDGSAVAGFFTKERPDYVLMAAAKVGGILANDSYPADFILENLRIQSNVLREAHRSRVKRLLFLGSSCIYPKLCPQPIKEEYLLTGVLEATNRAYAVAKIAGIETCWALNRQHGTEFLTVMPTNLYGPGDNYNLDSSHVIPALIRKMVEATRQGNQEVGIWGSGEPRREFLHSDDMAEGCLFLLRLPDHVFLPLVRNQQMPPIVNIGYGSDLTIRELAVLIAQVVGFDGKFVFDRSKPDGTPRKLLDVSRIETLGWKAKIPLRDGLTSVCASFRSSVFPEYSR